MNRRGFLGSILALGVAPAIVRADSLMRVVPRNTGIIGLRDLSGNGRHLFYATFDGPTSRLVQPELMVLRTAHDEVTRKRVLAYLDGKVEEQTIADLRPAAWYRADVKIEINQRYLQDADL